MADDQVNDQKSPLDLLEDVLADVKDKAGEDIAQEKEQAARDAQLAASRAQKEAEDELKIQAQLTEMKTVIGMPEEQARQQQGQDAIAEKKQQSDDQTGYDIRQLDHTKI